MAKLKTIYDLKLNEVLMIDDYCIYRRVPGGWVVTIYTRIMDSWGKELELIQSAAFVPFNNEFERIKRKKSK